MAYLNICGFETGDGSEFTTVAGMAGSWSVTSTVRRSGTYSLKFALSGTNASVSLKKLAADGTPAEIALTTVYITAYVYWDVFSGGTNPIFHVRDSAGNNVVRVFENASHQVFLNGAASSGNSATLSTGQWYRLDITVVKNGTSTLSVDGGSGLTCTANNFTIDRVEPGNQNGGTHTFYYDDIAISDSALPGAGQVNILKPNGAGSLAQWTNGTASDYTAVDEVPHNSDTDYLMETGINGQHDLAMESAATGGVSGTIGAVKLHAIVRNVAAGAGSIALQSTSGGTAVTETAWTTGSTSYITLEQVKNLDNAAAAWTSTTIDSLQVGVVNANANDARCTSILAMVWCTGISAAQLVLSTIAATSTAAATVSTKATITPSAVAATSTVTATVSTPAQITPSTIAATSNAALSALSTPANLVLSVIAAVSNATATVTTPSLLTLSTVAAVSTAILAVSTPAMLTLSIIAAIATATLDLNLYVYPAGSSIQTAVAWRNSLYKPMNYAPLRYQPMRFRPPRYKKPF